jgi:hypothetical protein
MANRARERAISGGADPNSVALPEIPQLPMAALTGKGESILTDLLGFGADNPLGGINVERGKQIEKTKGGNARTAFKNTLNQDVSQRILAGEPVTAEEALAAKEAFGEAQQVPVRRTNDRAADRTDARARFTQGQQNFRQGRALNNAALNRQVQLSGQAIQQQNANTNQKRLQGQLDGKIGGSKSGKPKKLSTSQKKGLVEEFLGDAVFIEGDPKRDAFGDPIPGTSTEKKDNKAILRKVKETNARARELGVSFEEALTLPPSSSEINEAIDFLQANPGVDPAAVADELGMTLQEFETLAQRSFAR